MIRPSVASRFPAPRKRGSRTGFVVDPFRRRSIVFESGLENQGINVLVAAPQVAEIEEQVRPVRFLDRAGIDRSHCFDVRVRLICGRRVAIAFKYEEDAHRDGLAELLQTIAQQAFEEDANGNRVPFADEYRIVTERHLDGIRVRNAEMVVECGSDFDEEGQAIVRDRLAGAPRSFALGEVGRMTGLGSRGFRAAVALVQAGIVEVPLNHLIGSATMVMNRLFNS
ncbi:hypothetical protein ASG43_09190 [Aureimonas sp. Leaf454]|nr:hypothetical protein ASG43_09190 [Aureimonas sp. Leaf454]